MRWILAVVLGMVREGTSALAKLSLDERASRVADVIRQRFGGDLGSDTYAYPVATYDDSVVFRRSMAGGKSGYWQIGYSWTDAGAVELQGEPVAVVQTYKPVAEAAFDDDGHDGAVRIAAEILGPVREGAADPTGREWDVLLIREGMSKNRNRYSRKVLAEAAPLYEQRPMFVDHVVESGPYGRSGSDVVGFTRDVRPVLLTTQEGTGATLALAARACLVDQAFRTKLLEAHGLGNPDLFGLSHDVRAESVTATREDGAYYDVTAIRKVESTDWVLTPAAGGRVLRLVASDTPTPQLQEDARMLQKLIEALKAAGITVPENCDEATATRLLTEALNASRLAAAAGGGITQPASATREGQAAATPTPEAQALQARIALLEAANLVGARSVATLLVESSLAQCALPDPFKTRLRKRFTEQIAAGLLPTEDQVAAAIKDYVEDVGALREAGVVLRTAGVPRVDLVKSMADQVQERLDAFFDPAKPLQSLREMYIEITGDKHVRGRITDDVKARLSEAGMLREGLTTSSFDAALGDSITRRMVKDYAASSLATWRGTIAEVTPLSDFRTVRRIRFGGYGNLSIVAQGAPYGAMASPTDEEATYAPAKRGGTEQITLEMIKNDDVAVVRRIPGKLARAAAQTLHEFVWDMLGNNSNVYDAVALAAAGHSNIVTSAISGANLSALRLKIKQQTDMSSSKRLGLVARYLIVPSELEETAFQLTTSDRVLGSGNNDPNFVKKLNLETIVVEYWTDTNNYWVTAAVDQAPMIEVGFLDGQETPELFVQDLPSQGSMFSNDLLTYKLRHIYGGVVQDYRPFAGGIVA